VNVTKKHYLQIMGMDYLQAAGVAHGPNAKPIPTWMRGGPDGKDYLASMVVVTQAKEFNRTEKTNERALGSVSLLESGLGWRIRGADPAKSVAKNTPGKRLQ